MNQRKLDTVVVGAGLIGLTVAWELASRGHSVDLLDAREDVALETSYANGGLLTASMSDPWNAPGVHKHLLTSLCNPRSAMKLRPSAVPSLLSWGVKFLRNSSAERHWEATQANYLLAAYSMRATRELRERLGLKYDASAVGSLKVFRDPRAMEAPAAIARRLERHGLRYRLLDRDATTRLEPQLAAIGDHIAGALHFTEDEAGDAYLFCRCLSEHIENAGGRLQKGVTIRKLAADGSNGISVLTNAGAIECRRVVVAAGNGSMQLLQQLGISLPVRPVKGYSVTLDAPAALAERPHVPIVDDAMHTAVVPLGSRLRVAGTAEFAGMNRSLRTERIDNLLSMLAEIYPRIASRMDRLAARPWTGLRPMSADGRPFIGQTRIPGVYVSTGHGHLGWTLALGSARLLADLMLGERPAIDPRPYCATRQ